MHRRGWWSAAIALVVLLGFGATAQAGVTIAVTPTVAVTTVNQASAASNQDDDRPQNNSDTESTTVQVGYPRPKGASPMRLSLVPAYQQCSAPNRTHGTPLDSPSCGPPVRESTSLTLGTPDANGRPTKSTGFVRLRVLTGDPSTPPDEADVQLTLDITDVRRQSDLTDYTGEVEVDSTLQITDRWNGATSSGGSQSATAIAIPFVFPTTCAATVDPDLGATCGTTTTFEAIVPGGVPEGKRAIWQLGQFSVQDGGADGDIDTAPNAVFARQGVFVP